MNKKVYKDGNAVAKAFATFFVKQVKAKGIKTIAISGGSTPKRLFQILAEEFSDAKFWDQLKLFWVDERCVPHSDDESNYKMTKIHLLDHLSSKDMELLPVEGGDDPKVEVIRYGKLIEKHCPNVNGLPQFDMVLLGMGDDGHTASIFPDNMGLLKDTNTTALAKHPTSGQTRITITGPVINNAKEVHFLVTGANKKKRIAELIVGDSKAKALPSYYINPTSGELTWWLDEAANV